jgi:hypothetical protein
MWIAGDAIIRDANGRDMIVVAGTIRCCDWRVVRDDTHEPMNLQAYGVGGKVIIDYPDAAAVGSITVTPDETLTQRGFSAGASVGRGRATISCGRYGRPVDCRQLAGTAANLWVLGVMRGASS